MIAPMLPGARSGGRPCRSCFPRVLNVILDIASGGVAWWVPPRCFAAVSIVRGCFHIWRNGGLPTAIHHILEMTAIQRVVRGALPSAGVING